MKRKRVILGIGVGVLVAVVATIALWPGEKEPMYQGKSLSYWVEKYEAQRRLDVHTDFDAEPQLALDAMGTNCLPFLLHWVQYRPGLVRTGMARLTHHIAPHAQGVVIGWMMDQKSYVRAWDVPLVFGVLGSSAAPAIPELQRLSNGKTNSMTSFLARRCLSEISHPSDLPLSKRF